MKIVFVNSIFAYPSDTFPLGQVSLSTILNKNDFFAEIVDFSNLPKTVNIPQEKLEKCDIATYVNYILSREPNIISFYTMASTYHISISIAERLKRINKDVKIIFAGPQASVCAKETLEEFDFIDLVAIGEGEMNVLSLMEALDGKYELEEVCGIAFRDKNKMIKYSSSVELIHDLDTLPYLDYDLIPNLDKLDCMPIEVGRGCPFSCIYCSTKNFWKRQYRLKSNERIIEEIIYVKEKYEISKFSFTHDSFTANKKRIYNFCEQLLEQKLDIQWSCSSRPDMLDFDVIDKLYDSGCCKIFLGIESGSVKMQKFINKNLHLEQLLPIFEYLKDKGIESTYSFICGFPGESATDLSDTLKLIVKLLELGVVNIQLHFLTVLNGTELYERYKEDLEIDETSIYFDFNVGSNPLEYYEMFERFPAIFPHFYKIKSCTLDTSFLDVFVNYYLRYLLVNCKYSSKLILDYFNKDLYAFSQALHKYLQGFGPAMLQYYTKQIDNTKYNLKILSNLRDFIHGYDFKENDYIIKSIFAFDYDYFEFFCSALEKKKSIYTFDIFEIIKNRFEMSDYLKKKTIIEFVRTDLGKIIIQRVLE